MASNKEVSLPVLNSDEVEMPVNTKDLLQKFDRESRFLKLTGIWALVIKIIAVLFCFFQLYTAIFGVYEAQIQRPTHLMFVLTMVYLLYPFRINYRKSVHPIDLFLSILSIAICLYSLLNYEELMYTAGIYSALDLAIGIVGMLLVLEATRRIVGWPMVIIAVIFLVYAYAGSYFPGFLNHRGFNIERIVTQLWFTTEGILGIPLGVSSTFIFLFILFGAFLSATGIFAFFMDMASAVAGWASGGPAKIAVITSALYGTVTGSSVANTVGSGSFTIPMMKKLGYKPEFAGAIEAAASTGGQLMPPIMGAAAFLMAEFTNTPYARIALMAAIPSVLYFTGVLIQVHFEAKKLGLKGLNRSELPKLSNVLRKKGYLILPLVGIIYFLIEGSTPTRAALAGLALCILVGMIRKETRLNLSKFVDTFEAGARGVLGVAVACATAGLIIGVVTLTGVGLKTGYGLLSLTAGMMLPTLFLTMIFCLILGMGAPTTANYVITSMVAAPALLQMGIPIVAAHLFVFYFGIIADVTPPVALAAMAGAAVANSNPFKTGVIAFKLAIAAFLIPYFFVYSPSLILINASIPLVAQMVVTSIMGLVSVGAAVSNWYFTHTAWWERLLLFGSGLCLISPDTLTDIIGFTIFSLVSLMQYRKMRVIANDNNK